MSKIGKVKKALCIAAAAATMSIALTACGSGLNGTYSTDVLGGILGENSFTFSGGNKVKMSAFGIDADGTYEIKDGNIIVNYNLFGKDYTWKQSFSQEGNKIYIGGEEMTKK